jgi:hypothetical protein
MERCEVICFQFLFFARVRVCSDFTVNFNSGYQKYQESTLSFLQSYIDSYISTSRHPCAAVRCGCDVCCDV